MMPKHVIAHCSVAMCWLILCLFVALAASQSIKYEPTLNPKKTYEYKYEGVVSIGRDVAELAQSGVKLQCSFKITGVSVQTFLLQISNVVFEELNGVPGKSSFKASPNLAKRLAAELDTPFTFEYSKGQVVDIKSPPKVPNTIVNIVRGILGFLHVTIKTTQRVYELNEMGIHGVCHSAYSIEENASAKEIYVTQIVDINNCHEKAAKYSGMALAEENTISKQKGNNVVATVRYTFTVKSTPSGGLITRASAQERHHFSPFNVKGGNSQLQAIRNIMLLKETDTVGKPVTGQVKSRGNLMYRAERHLLPVPVLMTDKTKQVSKIADLIKRLAQDNIYQVNSTSSFNVLTLIQLLRESTYEDLEVLWKQLSGDNEHRRWLLDIVAEVTDERVLKFLRNRFSAGDISVNEAGQTLLLTFNHLSAEPEIAEMAKEFLTMPFSKSHPMLWKSVVLSYGSLVYRVCAYVNPCPVLPVQPLLNMANSGLTKNNDEDMVVALKALGNAGHPLSINTIMKFLPGFSARADSLSIRVQRVALQSLRNLAIRDPHNVQDISLTIFADRALPAEIRMQASMILLETKPSVALITAVAEILLQERDLQVTSFTYSQLSAIARSRTPDNQQLSTACNIAVKILSRKLGPLSYRYSKALLLDWFHDDFLAGISSELYWLKNGTSAIPTEIISKGKLHFIGRILQLIELGVRAEGLKVLLSDRPWDSEAATFASIMKILSDLKSLPKDKPLLSLYVRVFGQEVTFLDLNQDLIQQILKSISFTASKENKMWNVIQNLQKGVSWHWTKPFLITETRFIQPTCLGLPSEISKYYSALTGITVNAKAIVNPSPKEHLKELLSADISLQSDGYSGAVKDISLFHGINTEFFQSGVQLNIKTVQALPWNIALKINAREKNYEINFFPSRKATELLSIKSNAYAVSRNVADLWSAKMTPMMPEADDSERSFTMGQKDTYGIRDSQVGRSEMFLSKYKYCADTSVYGTELCTHWETKRAHYLKEYPLYYILGYTHFSCQLEPVTTVRPVEKIQIQISVGPNKNRPEHNQMMATTLFQGMYPTPDPVISVRVLSISHSAKPRGYETTAYYTPATQRNDTSVQLIISEVAEEVNWKLCADLSVDKIRSGAKTHFKWGAECQTYEVALKFSTASKPKPFINADMNWRDVPSLIQAFGQRVREYLPGASYVLGFNQKHETNADHKVSAMLVASAPDGLDVSVKLPDLTVYRQEIPFPFEFA